MGGRTRAAGAALGLMVLVLAGCSSNDTKGSTPGAGGGTTEATMAPSEDSSGGAYGDSGSDDSSGSGDATGAATVMVASTNLGDVLVDGAGMTLYMYDPDKQGAPTCYEGCAKAWPPLTTEGAPAVGDGADDSKLGTVDRTDGTTQVTYDGWPLYYWAQDSAPGDTTGQAVSNVWWVLNADGEPIRG